MRKNYRKAQFEKLASEYSDLFKTRIKITNQNGETNWLDIENNEFEAIQNILLNGTPDKN